MQQVFGAHIAAGPRRIRATAQAAKRRIETVDPGLDGRQRIGQGHAAGIVEMQGQLQRRKTLTDCPRQCLDLTRIRHASGVTQGHAASPQLGKTLDPVQHLPHSYIALHRATEHRRQRHIDRHRALANDADHFAELGKRLLAAHAQVGTVVRFAD
ncbi:hypothetical protein D3C81_1811180 [compost metagenome]